MPGLYRYYSFLKSFRYGKYLHTGSHPDSVSYSKSYVQRVINYIHHQEAHHKKLTFIQEYHEFLKKFEVEFDERYFFKPVEYEHSSRMGRNTKLKHWIMKRNPYSHLE